MKQLFLSCLVILLFCPAIAQISQGGFPFSLLHRERSLNTPAAQKVAQPDMERIHREDSIFDQRKGRLRFGALLPVNYSNRNTGSWIIYENGDRLWRLHLRAKSALALSCYFDRFFLPEGSEFFIYSPDYKHILGAFTHHNNNEDQVFASGLLPGDAVVLEYYEPAAVAGQGILSLAHIGYAYRHVRDVQQERGFGEGGFCEVNVNCEEGVDYQDIKRSIIRMVMVDSDGQWWGTGTLVNTTRNDHTPYVLTAEHNIIEESTSEPPAASYFNQYLFFFNYEGPGCDNPASEGKLDNQSMAGCQLIARSHDQSGITGSDFALLEINQSIPAAYNPYFAGWDATNTSVSSAVCIHHPWGDLKKISKSGASSSTSYAGKVSHTHWQVNWLATSNGHGVTEQGSSGSPLINSLGQVIGTLTGGTASCTFLNGKDYFGKFSYHWDANGSDPSYQLKYWLDPNATGASSNTGIYLDTTTIPLTQKLKLYPNPANDQLNVKLPTDETINSFKILGTSGQMWHHESIDNREQLSISVRQLPTGVYVLILEGKDSNFNKKFVIFR